MSGAPEQKPILSLLADDPAVRPRIETFVLALAETVDTLQDLEQAARLGELREAAERLEREAGLHGFPLLAESARDAADAAQAASPKRVRDALVRLTDVAYRVRLGHRGTPPPGF